MPVFIKSPFVRMLHGVYFSATSDESGGTAFSSASSEDGTGSSVMSRYWGQIARLFHSFEHDVTRFRLWVRRDEQEKEEAEQAEARRTAATAAAARGGGGGAPEPRHSRTFGASVREEEEEWGAEEEAEEAEEEEADDEAMEAMLAGLGGLSEQSEDAVSSKWSVVSSK